MKNKTISTVLAVAMLFSLAACSDTSSKSSEDETDAVIETSEVEEESETTTEEATTTTEEVTTTTEEVTTTTEETTTEPEPNSWFDSKGLTITPQGDFDFLTEFQYSTHMDYDVNFKSNVTVTETTDNVEEGYKMVQASFTIDFSDYYSYADIKLEVDDRPSSWISAFDRYTGISFEPGDVDIPIEYNGENINVYCTFDWSHDYDGKAVDYCVVTVFCPIDYDGAVFYIGHGSGGASDIQDDIDLSARLYTIDEFSYFPDNGYPYNFFSANDM